MWPFLLAFWKRENNIQSMDCMYFYHLLSKSYNFGWKDFLTGPTTYILSMRK